MKVDYEDAITMLRFVTMPSRTIYSNFEIPARVNTNYEISNVKKQMLRFHIKCK